MSQPFVIKIHEERMIRADVFVAEQQAQANVIICHGFKGFKDWGFFPHVATQLAQQHINVITFNFSHNGIGDDLQNFTQLEHFAVNTYAKELEDLDTIVKQVGQGFFPGEEKQISIDSNLPLFLLGHSKGAGVSLIYGYDNPELIHGVISWNGITNVDIFPDELKQAMVTNGRAYIQNARTNQDMPLDVVILEDIDKHRQRYDIIERAPSSTLPIVLLQGTEDRLVLLEGSSKLVKQNDLVNWIKIEAGTHTFNAVHPFSGTTKQLNEAIEHSRQFIGNHI